MTDTATRDVTAEVTAWLEENWDPDITVREWWERLGLSGWGTPTWPDREVFFELDGQGHEHQPVYDAVRETAVVAATGWLPGRFTWSEITRIPVSTQGRFTQLRAQSDRRRAA